MKREHAIALTGGLACGKSEVAGFLAGMNIPVMDTDALAHALLAPGHWLFEKVVAEFGREYVTAEGTVDRRKLGRRVFSDAEARGRLNALMHPVIYDEVFAWLDRQAGGYAAAMVPLLFETGMEGSFGRVLVVASEEALMIRRMRTRGWTEEEARARMAAQWPLEEKVRRADAVIWNNDDLPALRQATHLAWQKITAGKETTT